jgi:hypothetical protein
LLPQSAAQRHPIMHWGAKTRSSRRSDVDSTSPERTSIHSIQQERDTAGRSRLFSALGGKLSPEHPRYDKFVSSMHYERALAEHRRGSSPTPHRRGGFREGSRIATSVSSRRSEDRLSERRSADGTRVGSERSFVRSGGCSPSSGRAATSSPLALSPESFRCGASMGVYLLCSGTETLLCVQIGQPLFAPSPGNHPFRLAAVLPHFVNASCSVTQRNLERPCPRESCGGHSFIHSDDAASQPTH